jgi:hypothetical protein
MTAALWNTHEHAARGLKVARLCAAFEARVAAMDPDVIPAPLLAGIAQAAPDELWRAIAELDGIAPPSAQTITQARATLAMRAREAGHDPFRGLPR